MFTDDQFTKYVNDRFPAIGDGRQRKINEAKPAKVPIVLLAQIEPQNAKRNESTDQAAPPLSQAA